MRRFNWWQLAVFPFVALFLVSGCVYTTVGTKLAPITPPQPVFHPSIEYTVGDFSFTLEGGKLITSNYAGRELSDAIFKSWKDRGYISDVQYVEKSAFTGKADYDLTLSGTLYGESSIGVQILSGLTLMILPYSVTQHYDIQYLLQDVKTGEKYSAAVEESNKTYVELFLVLALPFGQRGQNETMQRIGDHLYEQFRGQGAFQQAVAPAATP